MKILMLAPQPFYQERGTPIAVMLLLKSLSQRGDEVDLLTFHEGEPVTLAHVRVIRIPALPGMKNLKPGFSWKKVVCDIALAWKAF